MERLIYQKLPMANSSAVLHFRCLNLIVTSTVCLDYTYRNIYETGDAAEACSRYYKIRSEQRGGCFEDERIVRGTHKVILFLMMYCDVLSTVDQSGMERYLFELSQHRSFSSIVDNSATSLIIKYKQPMTVEKPAHALLQIELTRQNVAIVLTPTQNFTSHQDRCNAMASRPKPPSFQKP